MIEVLGAITTVLAVTGVILNNHQMIFCFYFWLASNSLSAFIHIRSRLWSLAVRDLIFFILAIDGIIRWSR